MLCLRHSPQKLPAFSLSHLGKVDISLLLKPKDEEEAPSTTSAPRSASVPTTAVASSTTTAESIPLPVAISVPIKRQQGTHPSESPAKKQSKWSAEEDEKIIRLRGDAMKWEDISKQLPGRSAISCRLHYQNYLERRSEWDEDRKNKLARLYERYVEPCVTTSETTKLTELLDSSIRCGHRSQKKCPSPGEQRKPCTGNLESRKWPGEQASRPSHCPARVTQALPICQGHTRVLQVQHPEQDENRHPEHCSHIHPSYLQLPS